MNSAPFWKWVNERHHIWDLRHRGYSPPWTKDPILSGYRFCNVFRELDTVTVWIDQHIRQAYPGHPRLWFMLAAARVINWPPTLHEVLPYLVDWKPGKVYDLLHARMKSGEKVYTGAYMLKSEANINKAAYTVHVLLQPLLKVPHPVATDRMETWWIWFQQFRGWGGFLAYEVVCDLRWTHVLRDVKDTHTWANAGPGALRGLKRLLGVPLTTTMNQQEALRLMRELLAEYETHASAIVRQAPVPFELREVEHSLCETDKYLRVLNGEGTPRSKYTPPRSDHVRHQR